MQTNRIDAGFTPAAQWATTPPRLQAAGLSARLPLRHRLRELTQMASATSRYAFPIAWAAYRAPDHERLTVVEEPSAPTFPMTIDTRNGNAGRSPFVDQGANLSR